MTKLKTKWVTYQLHFRVFSYLLNYIDMFICFLWNNLASSLHHIYIYIFFFFLAWFLHYSIQFIQGPSSTYLSSHSSAKHYFKIKPPLSSFLELTWLKVAYWSLKTGLLISSSTSHHQSQVTINSTTVFLADLPSHLPQQFQIPSTVLKLPAPLFPYSSLFILTLGQTLWHAI